MLYANPKYEMLQKQSPKPVSVVAVPESATSQFFVDKDQHLAVTATTTP
ncbi:hypothetical protein NIES970_29610 (plasmid) [[Synechococcus] sp. NIES-970]|nr:hypothetical protein NIES970_29610 [[Synechococcus] sp. NIES-970]